MEAQSDMPIREERLLSHEVSYTHLYAHFTRSAEDALQITIEKNYEPAYIKEEKIEFLQ